jgi:hypothetical protein
MKLIHRNYVVRALIRGVLALTLLVSAGAVPCLAQSYAASLGSALPLGGLESVIGPIFPASGIGSTFRSELSAGVSGGDVRGAKLVGSQAGEISLRRAFLDEAPLRFDAYANLRLWRFGFRAKYTNFETRAQHVNLAKVDFSGLTLGADVDVVQFPWLSLGACVDFYLYDPILQGPVFSAVRNPNPPPPSLGIQELADVKIVGRQPSTIGGYLRYVPPEILGYPLHFEAWVKVPFLAGSKLTSFGAALVFRPQIYRFDVACKLKAENQNLKFSNEPSSSLFIVPAEQKWEVDMEWNLYGGEIAIYF